jgi:hypothetical protein
VSWAFLYLDSPPGAFGWWMVVRKEKRSFFFFFWLFCTVLYYVRWHGTARPPPTTHYPVYPLRRRNWINKSSITACSSELNKKAATAAQRLAFRPLFLFVCVRECVCTQAAEMKNECSSSFLFLFYFFIFFYLLTFVLSANNRSGSRQQQQQIGLTYGTRLLFPLLLVTQREREREQ